MNLFWSITHYMQEVRPVFRSFTIYYEMYWVSFWLLSCYLFSSLQGGYGETKTGHTMLRVSWKFSDQEIALTKHHNIFQFYRPTVQNWTRFHLCRSHSLRKRFDIFSLKLKLLTLQDWLSCDIWLRIEILIANMIRLKYTNLSD